MAAVTIALVVLSAFLHAVWNAILKRESASRASAVAVVGVAAVSGIVLTPFLPGAAFPAREGIVWSILAGVCEGGYIATLALALKNAPLGLAYVVARGGAIAFVWPLSAIIFGERIRVGAIAGALVLLSGLAIVGMESRRRGAVVGVLWAALSALFIGGYHLLFKQALETGAHPVAMSAVSLTIALPINLTLIGKGSAHELVSVLVQRPLPLLGAGVLCTASFLTFLLALKTSGAGAMVTLRNISIVFAQGLAWLMGEAPTRKQVTGALLVTLGAIVVGWLG